MNTATARAVAIAALEAETGVISRMADAPFAGTVVAVAPDGAVFNMTVFGNNTDPAYFWSNLITQVKVRLNQIESDAALPLGFRR